MTDTLTRIERAERPGDLFPDGDDAQKLYRQLARDAHPDRNPNDVPRAAAAFARLSELYAERQKTDAGLLTVTTKRATYEASGPVLSDALADHYDAGGDVFVRVPRASKTDDLMQREVEALKTIRSSDDFPEWYAPRLIEAARLPDGRRTHVVRLATGLRTLHELRELSPGGVHVLDLAWMLRRVLTALHHAQSVGLVYGAPVPSNVSILPELHGVVLTNWSNSAPLGGAQRVLTVDRRYRDLIAPEVLAKEPPTEKSDVYTSMKMFELLAGPSAPRQYRAFFRGSTLRRSESRPAPLTLLREFDELIERLHGPRRFRPFKMPDQKTKEN